MIKEIEYIPPGWSLALVIFHVSASDTEFRTSSSFFEILRPGTTDTKLLRWTLILPGQW